VRPGGDRGARRLIAAALTAALAAVMLIGWAAPASAHASLVGVTPADGQQLLLAPTAVVLTFSEPIDARFVDVVVDAGGQPLVVEAPRVEGVDVVQPLPALPAEGGSVLVRYRVVSADGHPIDGQTGFTVEGQATAPEPTVSEPTAPEPTALETAAPEPTVQGPAAGGPAAASPGGTEDGSGMGLAMGAAAVTVLVAGGAVVARRRRPAGETMEP
jgi:methionine-rich copper-binding protein CopC